MLRAVGRRGARAAALNRATAGFHSGSRLLSQNQNGNKSPFQVFVDTFKQEWGKSKELQENIKALSDETGRMSESAAFKRAKEALEKAKSGTQEASSMTGEGLKKAGKVVGTAATAAWDSSVVKGTRKVVSSAADSVDRATEPIRQTEIYKDIKNVIDDGSSMRYGGFEEKEARKRRRELEEQRKFHQSGMNARVHANPEAGTGVIPHATAKPDRNIKDEFERSALGKKWQDLKISYEESENGLISSIRSVTDKIGSFFEETEGAKVIRLFKEMDPTFRQEDFLREVREYILPEVLDAYVKGDGETLKVWLSDAPYNVWKESTKQHTKMGAFAAGRVLDIRGVDILSSKILPQNQQPVFVIGCRAQEVHLYKNVKTGEIVAGVEDQVQLSTYAMVITRIPEEMENEETHGWKITELVRGQTRDWT